MVEQPSVGTRAARGALALTARSGLTQGLQLVSALVIARNLDPTAYAAVAIAATVVGFARLVGDLGLSGMLIQRPGHLDDATLESADLAFLATTAVAVAGLIAAAPAIRAAYDGPRATAGLVVVFAVTLLVDALRFGPGIRLRRGLAFGRIGLVDTAESATLYTIQIGGLLAGLGVAAFGWAFLGRALVGTVLWLRLGGGPVWPRRRQPVTPLVRRSLVFQATPILLGVFGVAVPLVVATTVGGRELGLWAWSTVLVTPVVAVLQIAYYVAFPVLSRLYERDVGRGDAASTLMLRVASVTAGAAAGTLAGLARPIVEHVFDPRWLPATTAVRLALAGALPISMTLVLAAALESRGRAGYVARSAAIAGACGFALVVPLARFWGLGGAALVTGLAVPLLNAALLARSRVLPTGRTAFASLLVAVIASGIGGMLSGWVDGTASLAAAAAVTLAAALLTIAAVDAVAVRSVWAMLRSRPE